MSDEAKSVEEAVKRYTAIRDAIKNRGAKITKNVSEAQNSESASGTT